jgi:hypothetical protein
VIALHPDFRRNRTAQSPGGAQSIFVESRLSLSLSLSLSESRYPSFGITL